MMGSAESPFMVPESPSAIAHTGSQPPWDASLSIDWTMPETAEGSIIESNGISER